MQNPAATTVDYEVPPEIRLRQRLIRLGVGESARLKPTAMTADQIIYVARAFASGRKLRFSFDRDGDVVVITRHEHRPRSSIYAQLDALGVGESKLFDVPPSAHQGYRQAATTRNRTGGVMLTCTREGDALRITRLPVTDDERQRHPSPATPQRQTKYGLERLAHADQIIFAATPAQEMSVRVAVSVAKKRHGWDLSCQRMPGGMMRVYRADKAGRIKTDEQNPQTRSQKPTKYGLERLSDVRQIRVEVNAADQQRLRIAASQKARAMGWTVRCRLQDDGSMLVYRTDAQAPGMAPTDSTIRACDSAIT